MNPKFAEVLRNLQNSKFNEIPPYSQEIILIAKEELAKLTADLKVVTQKKKQLQQNSQLQKMKPFIDAKSAALFDEMYRIKRFLLIYNNYRTTKIQDQFWDFGGDIKNSQKPHLSEAEKKYLVNYKTLIMEYVDDVGLDVTVDIEPPLQTNVFVKFEQDCGEIMNQKGQVIKLSKNEGGYMKKRLVESFLKQGQATISK